LKGNTQNEIQPYVQRDRISWDNVEALTKDLVATSRDPDKVRTASTELDQLTRGNSEFSIYYAQF
jgi:hypothetical protein